MAIPQPQAAPSAVQPAAPPGAGAAQPNDAVQRIVVAAMKMIYDQGILQNLLKLLRAGDPADGLAQATLAVMQGLFEASNGTLPPPAFIPAVKQIMPLIAELAEAAGIARAEPGLVQQAAALFMQKFKQLKSQPPQGAPQPAAPPAGAPPTSAGLVQQGMGG